MNWKYTDGTGRAVYRALDGGGVESCLVEAIAEWIAQGNTIEPFDVDQKVIAMQTLAQADAPFTPRRLREFMRVVLEDRGEAVAEKLGVPLADVLAANPTYQIVKQYDDMAADARAKL